MRAAERLKKKTSEPSHPNEASPKPLKVSIVNLGCPRNLVDSQAILDRLKSHHHEIVDTKDAEAAIVNTCCFIEEARTETVDVVLELLDLKKKGQLKRVIVVGCFSERYGKDLVKELKGVDAFIGVPTFKREKVLPQTLLTPNHFAYVKICEGCYNECSFCAIPNFKGPFSSRTIESVIGEIKNLDGRGTKEINIIGQDITAYGLDIYKKKSLAKLTKEIVKVTDHIRRIRLLYTLPGHITDELIDTIAGQEKVCKYVDIPLQHINNRILKMMKRTLKKDDIIKLIQKIRTRIPGVFLRTAFIVGFPGETEKEFLELLDFIKEVRFERLGVFTYSREEGTEAYGFPDQLPEEIKHQRRNVLMNEQQKMSLELHKRLSGKTFEILIDESPEDQDNVYVGRSEYDAPEIDGVVYVRSERTLKAGDMVHVKITDAFEYDLTGEAL